jgi:hypothetical protein
MPRDTFDSPWKRALRHWFQPFAELLLPDFARKVEWERGVTFLDKELEQLAAGSEEGDRICDLLAKVSLVGEGEMWVLVHVEVQASRDADFPLRMLIYHYRIFDRHHRPIVSVAILADGDPAWRPDRYVMETPGCRLTLEFSTVKLLDWDARREELEQSRNPFAMVVLAHLDALATKGDDAARLERKWDLVRRLTAIGYTRNLVVDLFRFLDQVLSLPPPQDLMFIRRIHAHRSAKAMRYLSSIERLAREEGLEKGREEGCEKGLEKGLEKGRQEALRTAVTNVLAARFGPVPRDVSEALDAVTDGATLSDLVTAAATVEAMAAFVTRLRMG